MIELLEEFNIIIPHPNDLQLLKELKESNEKDKYLKSNINMIIPCLFNNSKPNDIEKSIFNLKNNSNNGKEILGRKYYFSFIPKGIYENLFNKICKSIGSTMRFWKNGFIVTSKDTYLTLEIIQKQYAFEPLKYKYPCVRLAYPEAVKILRGLNNNIGDFDDLK